MLKKCAIFSHFMKITSLTIYTTNLAAQKDFYTKTLGLELISETEELVRLRAGKSKLRLAVAEAHVPYHFAFNIPSNKDAEALDWLKKKKVNILKDGRKELLPIEDWNSSAIYFHDADNNIVEFISRKNLGNDSKKKFAGGSILEISEIGLVAEDLKDAIQTLKEDCDLELYSGDEKSFAAMGTETGLFICLNNKKKETWFPTKDVAQRANFEVIINIDESPLKVKYEDGEVDVYIN